MRYAKKRAARQAAVPEVVETGSQRRVAGSLISPELVQLPEQELASAR